MGSIPEAAGSNPCWYNTMVRQVTSSERRGFDSRGGGFDSLRWYQGRVGQACHEAAKPASGTSEPAVADVPWRCHRIASVSSWQGLIAAPRASQGETPPTRRRPQTVLSEVSRLWGVSPPTPYMRPEEHGLLAVLVGALEWSPLRLSGCVCVWSEWGEFSFAAQGSV